MTGFCPALWPEEPVLIILDNPGAREGHEGIAFICGTRQICIQHLE